MAEQSPGEKLYHDELAMILTRRIMDVFIYLQRRDAISADELDECRLRLASERLAAGESDAERRRNGA